MPSSCPAGKDSTAQNLFYNALGQVSGRKALGAHVTAVRGNLRVARGPDASVAPRCQPKVISAALACTVVICSYHPQMVYFVAGVGIVYTPPTGDAGSAAAGAGHCQHFFLGHTDDIKAMTLCPAEVDVAGKKFPGRTIAATGQVSARAVSMALPLCPWEVSVWHVARCT